MDLPTKLKYKLQKRRRRKVTMGKMDTMAMPKTYLEFQVKKEKINNQQGVMVRRYK